MNPTTSELIILIACVLLGFLSHVVKRIIQYRVSDPRFSFADYLFVYPYHLFLNVLLTTGITLSLYQLGQLNGATAFFSGYASNSIVSILRARLDYVAQNTGANKGKDPTDPSSDL